MSKKIRVSQVEDIHVNETYLSEDLKITTKFGEVQQFDSGKTYATIKATKEDGTPKTLSEALMEMLTNDANPTVTAPTISLNSVSASGASSGFVEVGASVVVKATPVFTDGKYTVGGKTTKAGCTPTHTMSLKVGDAAASQSGTQADNTAKTFTAVTAPEDGKTIVVNLSTAYTAGTAMPLSALEVEKPDLKIAASSTALTKTATAATARRKVFYGVDTTDSDSANSKEVRALKGTSFVAANNTKFNLEADPQKERKYLRLVIAVPTARGIKSVKLMNTANNQEATSALVKSTAQVSGAGDAGTAEYDVWVYRPGNRNVLTTEKFEITLLT